MTTTRVSYNCTALVGTNKVGNLKKGPDGYYEVVLGALQAYNSAGAFYPLQEAKELFNSSSCLQRRIKNGALNAENGHPRRAPGMTEEQWFQRVNDLYEPNLCAHIRQIDLSFNTLKDSSGRELVAVMGWVKPSGAGERFLERQMENPNENVCFSVRSFTRDVPENGVMKKYLVRVVTYDKVNEPGIGVANKYSVPSLESLNIPYTDGFEFDTRTIRRAIDNSTQTGIGMESMQEAGSQIFTAIADIERKTKIYVPASFHL